MSRTVQCMKDDDGGLRVVLGLLAGLAFRGFDREHYSLLSLSL